MTTVADACLKDRRKWRCLAAVLLASLSLFLALAGATGYSTTKLESTPVEQRSDLHTPVAPTAAFAPFLDIIPSQDGTALFISAGRTGELPGTVFANIGIGPGHDKDSYTMVYSGTAQAYVTTATGFTPGMDDYAPMNITTTSGLDTGMVEFSRDYVQAATPRSIFARDGNLKLRLVSTDTITFDTYVAVVPSYAPPGPAPLGHRFVGSTYSVRAAGALVTTDKPMSLRLAYNATTLAGADPHTLAIFAWDAFNKRWDDLGGRLFYDQQYLSVATSRFTTYALMSAPAWWDDFDDFSGLDFAETSNVTLGLQGGHVELLVLSYMATSGTAVSKPITPTAGIASWGNLTFTRTVDPPTTTLTVDVLSLDGTEVLTDVTSGASVAGIDPAQYPSLKLRANLSSTVVGETPALDEWRLTWQSKACYDVNGDDKVDITDIQDVANHWHGLLPYDQRYDKVSDGIINILDVMKVVAHWGERCGGTPSAP